MRRMRRLDGALVAGSALSASACMLLTIAVLRARRAGGPSSSGGGGGGHGGGGGGHGGGGGVTPGIGGGNNACKKYCGPAYFVGGAYVDLHRGLATADVPPNVGYWLHPMGFAAAQGFMPSVLKRFGTRQYAYEADLDAWTDGSNPLQTDTPGVWGSMLNAAAGSPKAWRCALFAAWAHSGDVASGACIAKYKALFAKVRGWGCQQCWVFWSPPSEPAIANAAMQSKPWRKILTETGASGAIVDHPARRTDCVDVSVDFLRAARALGLATGWVFDGADSAAATAAMKRRVSAAVRVDVWAEDNFNGGAGGRGSSWGEVSGQLRAAMA